jgi:ParB family chromosome partitioning protein
MPDPIDLIPLDAIDAAALTRDRTAPDPEAQQELVNSISLSGLRMPVEVFELAEPSGPLRYGLISGFRRLAAFRTLHADLPDAYAAIPAFVRRPESRAGAVRQMVEENAIRAGISPWEQAMAAATAAEQGLFENVTAAVEQLYTCLGRDKRRRIRAVAQVIEELDGHLTAPETLSQRQLLRLAAALARGYGPLMRHALEESRDRQPDAQWRILLPVFAECEDPAIPDPGRSAGRRDRPRRTCDAPRHAIRVRRELTRDGWCLHFTGRDARRVLLDDVFDYIEHMFSPA